MSQRFSYSVFGLTLLFIGVFFLFPILVTVKGAFTRPQGGFTLEFVGQILGNPLYREGLLNSLKIAVGSTLLSLLIAMPLALLATRYTFPGKTLLSSAILVPLILPPFVGALGLKQILGRDGVINSALANVGLVSFDDPPDWLGGARIYGVMIMISLHLYPIFFLNISAALANLDPAMEESASNLGCSPWRRFWRITLPLAIPGIFAGGVIVFIWSFTELGVPLMFDFNRVMSVQIWDGSKDMGGNPAPYAMVVMMMLFSVGMFVLSKRLLGKQELSSSGRAATASHFLPLHGRYAWGATLAFAAVSAVAILPHFGVIFTALAGDWYRTVLPTHPMLTHISDALGHELTLSSIRNSLLYASCATLINLVLGVSIAYIVTRTKVKGAQLLDALAMMPLAVPGLVVAFGYLAVSRPGQPLDWLMTGKNADGPILLLIVAYALRRLPYIVRSAVAGFQQTSVSLEEAAQNLGASPLRTLRRITLPLITANLVAGGLLAFAFAMLEVSDSLILAQKPGDYPITNAIYNLAGNLGNGENLACALGAWAMVFLGITIIGASLILGKKMGALFRV